ncbi:DnaA N-terminal domain-containing protein [Litorivita pollutaquae]|nr:DnaA N-terminal domain-containing protein [Litorivita pollutaquae]
MQGRQIGQGSPDMKAAGPGSQAIKYDILTALLAMASSGPAIEARLSLRLSLLITARFNWRIGTFAVGQREMARMWGVSERTAKREMAAMRALGWVAVAQPSAKGRVAQHRIVLPAVLRATMPYWDAVGPDFAARMAGAPEPENQPPSNVVPLHAEPAPMPTEDETGWGAAARRLQQQDPAIYSAWLGQLEPLEIEGDVLSLAAPSRFVADYIKTHHHTRVLAALVAENRAIRDIHIIAVQS